MCLSTPKPPEVSMPPVQSKVDETANMAAGTEAERRRRRLALSRAATRAGGAMQGSMAAEAGAKTRLGD